MLQYIEYGYYDFDSSSTETKENITQAVHYNPSCISVLPQYVKSVKKILPKEKNIRLATVIDYPFGLSGHSEREAAVKNAITNGAESIEIICPNYALCNRKYDAFRLEIDCLRKICIDNQVDLKYTLEYKTFSSNLLYKIVEILYIKKIATIYSSSGFFSDDINDSLIVSSLLKKRNSDINVIATGRAWTASHFDLILSNEHIFAYKATNIHTLEKISNKMRFLG